VKIMPTYDYECKHCGHTFELFQSMSARVKCKCPECGERTLERLIGTGAGIIFKGSGFYETDYRSASYKKDAASENNGDVSKKKTKTDSGGSDSKEKKKESTDTAG